MGQVLPVNYEQFCKALEVMNLNECPRLIGNPRQEPAYGTEDVYARAVQWAKRGQTCFTSHNSYPIFHTEKGKIIPDKMTVSTIFFDFDNAEKPENAQLDAINLVEYLRAKGIAYSATFSGSKGFHVYIKLKPLTLNWSWNDESADSLKRLVGALMNYLKSNLQLRTLDQTVIGDPRKLCRLPFTPHVSRTGVVNGRYCVPVTWEQLRYSSFPDIVEYSTNPDPENYGDDIEPTMNLFEVFDHMKVDLKKWDSQIQYQNAQPSLIDDDIAFVALLRGKCPGLVNEMNTVNPAHKARVHTALFAKSIGMTLMEFEGVWQQMGKSVGYVDLHNTDYRINQLESLFQDARYVKPGTCGTLKRDGLCIGETCPKWRDDYEITKRTVKRRRSKEKP